VKPLPKPGCLERMKKGRKGRQNRGDPENGGAAEKVVRRLKGHTLPSVEVWAAYAGGKMQRKAKGENGRKSRETREH